MTTSKELTARANIIEAREKLDISIKEIQDRAKSEMKPFEDELLKLQGKCPHPGMPYNGHGTSLGWTCPDCKASL